MVRVKAMNSLLKAHLSDIEIALIADVAKIMRVHSQRTTFGAVREDVPLDGKRIFPQKLVDFRGAVFNFT
jgi:hypothetical protein